MGLDVFRFAKLNLFCVAVVGVVMAAVRLTPAHAFPIVFSGSPHVAGGETLPFRLNISDTEIDEDGSVYVAGEFFGTLRIGDESVSSEFTGVGDEVRGIATWPDIFVVKIDPEGEVEWLQSARGTLRETVGSMVLYDGDVYLTGLVFDLSEDERQEAEYVRVCEIVDEGEGEISCECRVAVQFGGITVVPKQNDPDPDDSRCPCDIVPPRAVYVAKLSGEGDWEFAETDAGLFTFSGTDLAVDQSGIYATGVLGGRAGLPGGDDQLCSERRPYLAKLTHDADPTWEWAYYASDVGLGDDGIFPFPQIVTDGRGVVHSHNLSVGDLIRHTATGEQAISTAVGSAESIELVAGDGAFYSVSSSIAGQCFVREFVSGVGQTNVLPTNLNVRCSSLAIDDDGGLYVTGVLTRGAPNDGQFSFGPGNIVNMVGDEEIFVARAVADGESLEWDWVLTAPAESSDPRMIGGENVRDGGAGRAVAVNGFEMVVSGVFSGVVEFGEERAEQGDDPTATYGFIAKGGRFGEWTGDEAWTVGEAIEPPLGARSGSRPLVEPMEGFYWSEKNAMLYPIRAFRAGSIEWLREDGEEGEYLPPVSGKAEWPAMPQAHVVGAPVELELSDGLRCGPNGDLRFLVCENSPDCRGDGAPSVPCGEHRSKRCSLDSLPCRSDAGCSGAQKCVANPGAYRYRQILYTDNGAEADDFKNFDSSAPGYTVLLYDAEAEELPDRLEVVRSMEVAAGEPLDGQLVAATSECEIGKALVNDSHRDPNNRNGWVVNRLARFDPFAYDRDTRSGPILPVNRDAADSPDDDMVVVWYQQNDIGISWPTLPVRYECSWPESAPTIIIASELGSNGHCAEVRGYCESDSDCLIGEGDDAEFGTCVQKERLFPLFFQDAHIYVQNDPEESGFNPNEEHGYFVPASTGVPGSGDTFHGVFALRSDLNERLGLSEPYVLLKYRDRDDPEWAMLAYRVVEQEGPYAFEYDTRVRGSQPVPYTATMNILPPFPLELIKAPDGTACSSSCAPSPEECSQPGSLGCLQGAQDPLCEAPSNQALFKDYSAIGQNGTWQGWWARAQGTIRARFDYPLRADFYVGEADLDGDGEMGSEVGDCIPFIGDEDGQQIVTYSAVWPTDSVPTLLVGETLATPKNGLPDIRGQATAEVAFSTTEPDQDEPPNELTRLVRIYDFEAERCVPLAALPMDMVTSQSLGDRVIVAGDNGNKPLTPGISRRIRYSPTKACVDGDGGGAQEQGKLIIKGLFSEAGFGEPFLLPNIMSPKEQMELLGLSDDPDWRNAVEALFKKSRNPNGVDADSDGNPDDGLWIGLEGTGSLVGPAVEDRESPSKALTAGLAQDTGIVTLAFNNRPGGNPVGLSILRVGCGIGDGQKDCGDDRDGSCGPYQGQVHVVESDNVFDERTTVRHSGDFAGDPSQFTFTWYSALKEKDCRSIPVTDPLGPEWELLGSDEGLVDFTIGGSGVRTLADSCVLVRYEGYGVCDNIDVPSVWAGEPLTPSSATDPRAQLVRGWLARVVAGLNPFDQRTNDFHTSAVDTFANALTSIGSRYEGPIAISDDADNLNNVGLAEIYGTVLERAVGLSLDGGFSIGAVNNRLLDVSARISDFYMLLGNEAYGDALDPTIGFDTSGQFGTLAPSIFAFQDQTEGPPDSQLSEELILLRGLDSDGPSPTYNRLKWNFTGSTGEIAYKLNYDITDQNGDDGITFEDAAILYPQGHGDAWGHYLTAIKGYYFLLQHPNFVWVPRSDSVAIGNSETEVDFSDERRFASAAAARARTGSQIVDLTYRREWVDDPSGQFTGYTDTDPERAFGVDEWARRAGHGAYLDWVVGNAILPPQSDKPPGIEKIDRTTVPELGEIVSESTDVQRQMDIVDEGLNPLGLAKNVVPFDLNPGEITFRVSKTHYEQIAERANDALANTKAVFDYANNLTELLRRTQDTQDQFRENVAAQERDFNNRLVEIFGSPYGGDTTYPANYEGPDLWNWDVSDVSQITGINPDLARVGTVEYSLDVPVPVIDKCDDGGGTCRFDPNAKIMFDDDGLLVSESRRLTVSISNRGFGRVKPDNWTTRESPGELQMARSNLLQAMAQLERGIANYKKLIGDIECDVGTIRAQKRFASEELRIKTKQAAGDLTLNGLIRGAKVTELVLSRNLMKSRDAIKAGVEALPKTVGFSNDATSGARAALIVAGIATKSTIQAAMDATTVAQLGFEQAKEAAASATSIQLQGLENDRKIFDLLGALTEKVRREPALRAEALRLEEAVRQSQAKLQAILAKGIRLMDSLVAFRKKTAAKVEDARYKDMAFRIFRGEALQKYRAQLDYASLYVYLAAAAYDYETNLLKANGDVAPGRDFLTNIVRQRSLGEFRGGEPIAGPPGLANQLAEMNSNFARHRTQLGFDNLQNEENRFSLRKELFRLSEETNGKWRRQLAKFRVPNLYEIEEFRRFAEPPRDWPGELPGLAIPIPTTVTTGLNFFGWPLGGGDSAYSAANFATKVRSVGVWFSDYNDSGLANTPRVYLIPTGSDVLRSPVSGDSSTREWAVVDQVIPAPFELTDQFEDQDWSPLSDPGDLLGDVRRYRPFRAHHAGESFPDSEVAVESRAIGRSVWNTRWMLFIPGVDLLNPADEGLNRLIYGRLMDDGLIIDPDGNRRDGQGISDILMFFNTYAY